MAFEDITVHARLKLFALWSSVMFFYIYGDYIELCETGHKPSGLQSGCSLTTSNRPIPRMGKFSRWELVSSEKATS